MRVWDSREVPTSIHTICNDLFDSYSDMGISHCMRMFSQEYPQKKKDARMVYSVLEKLFMKNVWLKNLPCVVTRLNGK